MASHLSRTRSLASTPTIAVAVVSLTSLLLGCATVKLEAPDKPIEINLNVNITQELRVKVDKDVDDLIASNPDIF